MWTVKLIRVLLIINPVIMDDMVCDSNVYTAFLEGKATKEETRAVLDEMMNDPLLALALNLSASVDVVDELDEYNDGRL